MIDTANHFADLATLTTRPDESRYESRASRGRELAARGAVSVVGPDTYRVKGSTGTYTVRPETIADGRVTRLACTCPDFHRHGGRPRFQCKHVVAVGVSR
jgi:uncharacterized Zn finger protein